MTEIKPLHYQVLIAGGGFAGAYCGKYLGKYFGTEASQRVALVADGNVFAFQPMLAEVVGAALSPLDVVIPLRQFCRGINVLQGNIVALDLRLKVATLDSGRFTTNSTITFDHIVLALGSVINVSQVPGMSEHGYILKNAWDAMRLRVAIIERLEEANLAVDLETKKRLLTFVVVGGGYSGVETAGQMLDLVCSIQPMYLNLADVTMRVVLVHSRDHLLPEIGLRLGQYAEAKLKKRGMEVRLDERVVSITAGKVFLSKSKPIDTHTVVSTIGNGPHPLLASLCKSENLENDYGRIVTEPTMLVKGFKHVWAVGDCAAIPVNGESSCPPTAQFAQRQGIQVSLNLQRALAGSPLKPFKYKSRGQLASIGHQRAVADIMGFQFSGFIAWFIWRTLYASKIPGLQRKLRVVIDWTLDLFFPRDISVIRTLEQGVLEDMPFKKGDLIVEENDPYISVYIIKAGRVDCRRNNNHVQTLESGDVLGGSKFTAGDTWNVRAAACAPTILVSIKRHAWLSLNQSPGLLAKTPDRESYGEVR